jgi:hypothetical protein
MSLKFPQFLGNLTELPPSAFFRLDLRWKGNTQSTKLNVPEIRLAELLAIEISTLE